MQLKTGLRLLNLLTDDRLKITIGDLPFAIGQILESGEGLIQVFPGEVVTQLLKPGPHGAAPAELAE